MCYTVYSDRPLQKSILYMEQNDKKTTEQQVKTWICSVCGYQHVGPEPPKKCPKCGVEDIYFDKVETGSH